MMAVEEEYDGDAWMEPLHRGPIAVTEHTAEDELAAEMAERLNALLQDHNGLEPTAEGWRQLALELALEYVPAFKIETPVDRTGPSGLGGRPVGMGNHILQSRMKAEMRQGKSQAEAARTIHKDSGGAIAVKTAQNALSRESQSPDFMRLRRYKRKAARAMKAAADKLSQQ
ncbi:hypothetical protein ASE23_00040 [Rhizobium sp. Root73]|uniref:hypothetical protein n=2 Tax=unclassified Rhizobium TaxID=2613769 RepID=UPI00072769DB|nr:hypothetical protein [Rhizobium sp. Root73]KRC12999.1 hypothetical protein ASE23_00040 [Rhizobium sp. Root73]